MMQQGQLSGVAGQQQQGQQMQAQQIHAQHQQQLRSGQMLHQSPSMGMQMQQMQQMPQQPMQPQQQLPVMPGNPGASQRPPGQQGQANWRTWQTDADYDQRKQLITHIFRLFTGRQRANNLRPEFKDKLPDFVRRLEEALYRTARTKEEYTDISTLEARLQNVARRMIRPGAGGNQSQQPNPLQNLLAEAQPQQPTITVAQTNGGMIGVNGSNQFQQQQPQQQRSPLLMQQNPQNSVQISPGMVNVTSTGFDAGGTGLQHQQQNFPGTSQAGPSMQGPNQAMQQQNGNFVPNMNMTVRPGGVPANGLVRGQASRDMTQATGNQGLLVQNSAGVAQHSPRNFPQDMSAGISQVQGQGQMVPSSQVITSQAPVQPGGGMVTMSPVLQQQHSAQQQIITQPQAVMINNPTQQATALGMSANPVVQQMPGQQGNQSLWMQQRQQQVLGQQQIIHPTTAQDLQGLAQPGINMPQHGSGAGGMAQQPGAVGPQGVPAQQSQRQPTPQELEALRKQQKWLLFLRHCIKCQAAQGQCQQWGQKCQHGKNLIRHIESCGAQDCGIQQCLASKKLLKHHQRCQNPKCLVCGPVNSHVEKQRQLQLGSQMQHQPGAQLPQMAPLMQTNMHNQAQQQIVQNQLQQQQQQQQQQMLQQQALLQQRQQEAIRNSAMKSEGMMQNLGMIPISGPGGMPTPGIQDTTGLIPTPGLMNQGQVQQPSLMPNQAGVGGMQLQQPNILRGQASLQGQGSMQNGMMMSGRGSGMIPTPNSSGGMMPTPHASVGMIPTPNVGSASGMIPNPGMQSPAMMPNPGMQGPGQMQQNQLSKRVKTEGQFGSHGPGGMQSMMAKPEQNMDQKPGMMGAQPLQLQGQQFKTESKPAGAQCTSLVETFSKEQIVVYLDKLKSETAYETQKATKRGKAEEKAHAPPADEVPCSACQNTRKSFFEPPVLYCYKCDKRIKENFVYYHGQLKTSNPMAAGGQNKDFYWCHSCFSELSREKSETIIVDGEMISKSTIMKKKNDDIQEEGWVQCDTCDAWVHQICGLFNRLLNDDNSTHYQCPECLLKGLQNGTRMPIAERPSSMLEAKDLPKTKLSTYLEQHIKKAVDEEQAERAKLSGKPLDETQKIDGLTVRVVNNVTKKTETKAQFYNTFKDKSYPASFNYRQKVILLFQQLDGVDVCLYCMYTQEYGDDNPLPNRRVSYLSYLDSIKYFRPDGITAAHRNVALRTFVYHELLIGYLAYLKERGFHQMFIWACPPTQGDDYILYAHPKTQKNPQLSKLREWYFKMLRRAHETNVVSRVSNLYDTYFDGGKDHRLEKCSAMDLPYFEGDYWPGVAESMLMTITEEQKAATSGKAATKKGSSSRSKASKGKIMGGASTDEQLMSRLGEAISGGACNKEDLMVVHLQHVCSLCRNVISGGNRYYAEQVQPVKFEGIKLESNAAGMGGFELCEDCYNNECNRAVTQGSQGNTRNRALPGGIIPHDLKQEHVLQLPATIEEWDPDMENEIFNTRQQFLSLCQGNHYQFDTIRRTRHSSMMVLYHLHNPTAPAFAGTCNVCNVEIEPGDGFRCTQCDDFDMCRNCQANGMYHEHPLERQTAKNAKQNAATIAQRRKVVQKQVQQTLELLKHSSTCTLERCQWHKCDTIKKVIAHMKEVASWRQPHDCKHCRQMAKILKYHATICKQDNCPVYMCKDYKDAMRRITQRQEQHRAQAYQKMLAQQRQQAG